MLPDRLALLVAGLFCVALPANVPPPGVPLRILDVEARGEPAQLPGAFSGPDVRDVAVYLGPFENLEKIDVATLDTARRRIDMAAYLLTDYAVIDALARAAARGVAVRILLDRGQWDSRPEVPPLAALRTMKGVDVRIKRRRVPMHLKAYEVDERVLRVGSANFSASGLKSQENDLTLIEARAAALRFHALFDGLFEAGSKP